MSETLCYLFFLLPLIFIHRLGQKYSTRRALTLLFSPAFLNIYVYVVTFCICGHSCFCKEKSSVLLYSVLCLLEQNVNHNLEQSRQCPLSAPSSGMAAKQGNICWRLLSVLPNDACSWGLCGYRTVLVNCVLPSSLCCKTLFSTFFIKLDSNVELPWQRRRIKAFVSTRYCGESCYLCSIDKGFLDPDARASLTLTQSCSN